MFTDFLLKAAKIAIKIICEPLPDEESYEGEYDIYEPSSRSLYTNEEGSTGILFGSSMGTKIDDAHNKY